MGKTRIESIDVLRGLTVFLMIIVNTPGSWSHVYAPFLHAKWHGCTLTDLVFPSFLFVVGLSMSQSFKNIGGKKTSTLLRKIFKRAGLIFLIGLLLNWFPFYDTHINELRIFGVLQRIALSFLGAGILIVLVRKWLPLVIVSGFLLLLHWLLLYFLGGETPYTLVDNIGRYLDIFLVGEQHVYRGFGMPFDPEGLLGTMTGIAQVILGFVIGTYIYKTGVDQNKRILHILIFSMVAFVVAKLWNMILPINKPLWTGSYVLYTVAVITALLLAMIEIVDKRKWNSWTWFFRVFGKNPLFSYALSVLVSKLFYSVIQWSDTNLYAWLYTDVFSSFLPLKAASLAFAFCFTMLIWFCSYILWKRNIIIKV